MDKERLALSLACNDGRLTGNERRSNRCILHEQAAVRPLATQMQPTVQEACRHTSAGCTTVQRRHSPASESCASCVCACTQRHAVRRI